MKKIYILLSRTNSVLSRTIRLFTGEPYTHVSIAFDEDMQELYSSARWNGKDMFPCGPCKEDLKRGLYKMHRTPCCIYELPVENSTFYLAKEEVNKIIRKQEQYHYNIIGLIFCVIGIPFRRKNYYFCSQFVGEILERSGAVSLSKDTSLLQPKDYRQLPQMKLYFQGYTYQLCIKSKENLE